ncbi:hypothetical protein [Lentzea sp. NBRC 102530]|uniref:hypothetical protein n=1 Tax=Lentzea sp. NBRC 102530 TaxID=3032201 RepID=UPI0024A19B5A|nr:hypothetical protein [Lentzea sp. NBRC 102530]GLY54845.1 hypothetical protein Lesp01_85000 [Lentzea sp. NBRC 102530]
MRKQKVAVVLVGLVVLSGCSMTVEEKYQHLRDVANKGADAHFVLVNENKQTTEDVCTEHYKVFVPDGAPLEDGTSRANNTKEWDALSLDYFVDSCVKGEPRVIQSRSSSPSTVPSSMTSAPASPAAGP